MARLGRVLIGATVAVCALGAAGQSSSYPANSNAWNLVFRAFNNVNGNTALWPRGQWRVNPTDSSNRFYSVLDALEQYRRPSGEFVFKMVYPRLCAEHATACPNNVNYLIWTQTSDPYTAATSVVTDFNGIVVPAIYSRSYAPFGGLCRSRSPGNTLLDGQPSHGNWWYSVGTYVNFGGTGNFPGPHFVTSQVEIYAWGLPRFDVNSPLWQLVFRQDATSGFTAWTQGVSDVAATGGGGTPSTAAQYSNISVLTDLATADAQRGVSGMTFKIRYPGMCSVRGNTCVGGRDYIIFTQSWNPLQSTPSSQTSFTPIDIGPYTGSSSPQSASTFGGLAQSSGQNALDPIFSRSNPSQNYIVGATTSPSACSNCLPGPMIGSTAAFTPAVEVYVYTNLTLPSCDMTSNYYQVNSQTHIVSCVPTTTCTLGSTYQTTAPTRFSDRVCSNVSTCWTSATDDGGQYEAVPATLFDDVQCAPLSRQCSDLPQPHFESLAPTVTSDRQCTVQPVCAVPFQYQAVAPTNTSARVCLPTTTCDADDQQVAAPTATSDTVCGDCNSNTQYVANNQCAAAQQCSGSTYALVPPIGTADRQCSPTSSCASSYQYEVAAPTQSTDRVCVSVTNCTGLTNPRLGSNPTTCQAQCTPCGANEAMQPATSSGGCPTCVARTPPVITAANPVSVQRQNNGLVLTGATVSAHGVDLVGWMAAMQSQLQATQSALIDSQSASDQMRIQLEARVATLENQNRQLQATLTALRAQQ